MENFKNKLTEIADNENIAMSGDKIKQDVRNKLRKDLLDILTADLKIALETESIQVERIEKGVALVLDNAKAGFIPIMVDLKFMNLNDFDLETETESYQRKLEEKAKALAEKEKAKALKIKADTERREKAKALREKAESESE